MSGLADIARHLRENKFIRMLGYFRPFLGLIALAMVMAGLVNGPTSQSITS